MDQFSSLNLGAKSIPSNIQRPPSVAPLENRNVMMHPQPLRPPMVSSVANFASPQMPNGMNPPPLPPPHIRSNGSLTPKDMSRPPALTPNLLFSSPSTPLNSFSEGQFPPTRPAVSNDNFVPNSQVITSNNMPAISESFPSYNNNMPNYLPPQATSICSTSTISQGTRPQINYVASNLARPPMVGGPVGPQSNALFTSRSGSFGVGRPSMPPHPNSMLPSSFPQTPLSAPPLPRMGFQPGEQIQPLLPPTPEVQPPLGGPYLNPQLNSAGPGLQYHGHPTNDGYGYSAPAARRSLDPDQMPNPITVMADDQAQNGGVFHSKEKGQVPPLVTTKYVAHDYGNASPRFIRSSLYCVPTTDDLMKQAGVPLGLAVSPLAEVGSDEMEPPVTDFGPIGPVRCVRCKAYMSPFMQFIDGGRRFQCAFCRATTEVAGEYFQHLDHMGQRLDRSQRPELCLGTYECLATKEYCRDSQLPNPPCIIFAIDVSYPMVKEGIVSFICANLKSLMEDLPKDIGQEKSTAKVGFMTYDHKINFYRLDEALSQPAQMTVGDVEDVFVPLVDSFFCDVEKIQTILESLFEQIPQIFVETRETETILGPVIQAAKEAFKENKCAGKLIIFHHNLPCYTAAPGRLQNRDDRKLLATEKEKNILTPQSKFYSDLAVECVSVGCSVDIFLFNNAYADVATINQVCRLTGGQLFKYTYFQTAIDGERFLRDLRHDIMRHTVYDAIIRVRTSTGVRPVDFYGSFYMTNSTDLELASLNSDMAIACQIKHDDKLTEDEGVYIQVALLFTAISGQRRLRIINLALSTSSSLTDMYRKCDLDTMINFTAKQSINRLMETNPVQVRDSLISSCAQILACYRKNCSNPSNSGQLILPECMKLLPIYTNCMIKSDALAGGPDLGCDERAFLMSTLSSMDVASSVVFFYPRLFPIHNVDVNHTVLPGMIRCTFEKLTEDGAYLLENGICMFMYLGAALDVSWIRDVFGVTSPEQIDSYEMQKGPRSRDNPLSRRVLQIIQEIMSSRKRLTMRIVVVKQNDVMSVLFKRFLCEDRTGQTSSIGTLSYVDFLCHMHKEIRALLN